MRRTLRVLAATLLRSHPEGDILQALHDCELSALETRLTRRHVWGCESCQKELRDISDLFDLLCAIEPASSEVLAVRERIVTAMAEAAEQNQFAIGDLRRLLGRRATERSNEGVVDSEVRQELAAFLGARAANSFLSRLPG